MAIRLEGDLAISSGTTVRALIERAVISAPPHTHTQSEPSSEQRANPNREQEGKELPRETPGSMN